MIYYYIDMYNDHKIMGCFIMFNSVLLYTNKLKELRRFYMNVLELEISSSSEQSFSLPIGTTELTFKTSEQPCFYHFAINIPGNQFSMLKHRIKERISINREGGRDEVYFSSFDADSMYFEDPAGNIIELIGRRKRDLFGDRKSTRLNSSHVAISYAVFCLKKKKY